MSGALKDRSADKDTISGDLDVRLSWNPLSRFSTFVAMTSSARFYEFVESVKVSIQYNRIDSLTEYKQYFQD